MRSVRTSIVVAASIAAVSWAGVSRADDVSSKKATTTKSQSTTTKSGSTGSGSTSSGSMSDTPAPSTSPPPSTTPADTWGSSTTTGTDNPYSSTQTQTQPAPVDMTQQTQPIVPPPSQTYSTTTTTQAAYDTNVSADRVTYETRPNRPMLITGLGIFGATYATSVIVGAASDRPADDKLFIPLVGPWLDLADRPCGLGDCGSREDWNQAMLIGSGVLQGVGVGLALVSLVVPEHHETTRLSGQAKAKAVADANKPKVNVLPVSVRSGGGIGATGTF